MRKCVLLPGYAHTPKAYMFSSLDGEDTHHAGMCTYIRSLAANDVGEE